MPRPSRKKPKVENPVTEDAADDEVEVEGEEDDHNINISTTDSDSKAKKKKDVVIRVERDPRLDRRVTREEKKAESWSGCTPPTTRSTKTSGERDRQTRGTSNVQASSSLSSGSCFICTHVARPNFSKNNHQARRLRLMRVNMFKDAVQEVLGNSYSMSPSSVTCEECDNIVEQVWDLQQEILLIKEELRKIITEALKHGGGKDLAKDNLGHVERQRRLGLECQDLNYGNGDHYFPTSNESVDGSPTAPPGFVEMAKEEPISDFDEGDRDISQDYGRHSKLQLEEEEDPNKEPSTTTKKRKSRIKAEMVLMANKSEDGQIESSDEEYSEFGVAEDNEVSTSEESSNNFKFGTNPKSKRKSSALAAQSRRKPIRCDICDINFAGAIHKRNHIRRIHKNERPFPCTLCDKRFFTATDLKRHGLSKHGEENVKYKCHKCGKQLPRRGPWLYHEFSVCKIDHGEAFYKEQGVTLLLCEFEGCPMKFITNRDYGRHIDAHTGRKDFICSKCGGTFTRSSALRKHEREIDCTRYGYKAKNCEQLRLKSKHACSFCPRKCVSIQGLAYHLKTVHDVEPPPGVDLVDEPTATCPVCGVTLAKRTMKKHVRRVHENIRNKSCPHCDKQFYYNSEVNSHIKRHHQEAYLIAEAEAFLRDSLVQP